MAESCLRLFGGFLGFVVTWWILHQTILHSGGDEGGIAVATWFWLGGWITVLFYYVLGIVIGMWTIIPAINLVGRGLEWIHRRLTSR